MAFKKPRLDVEIHQTVASKATAAQLKDHVRNLMDDELRDHRFTHNVPKTWKMTSHDVHSVELWPTASSEGQQISLNDCDVFFHVGRLDEDGYQTDGIEMEGAEIEAARQLVLPSAELLGVWSNLVFEDEVKESLLRYINTAMVMADKCVDSNIVDINRMVLLHGPPGTGKTTLCRALSQKLALRLSDRYAYGYLVEVNSHSLFSKWFSESGKLVQKMFDYVQELIEEPRAFVCVLVDEVESLAAARKASSNEPSDTIRVVNAVLTQLDVIKKNKNVLVLTTSNITEAVDLAFVDRADIVQYIGPPSASACYRILSQSFVELVNKGMVVNDECQLLHPSMPTSSNGFAGDGLKDLSVTLKEICLVCEGLSGRALRKLPFLALAEFYSFPIKAQDFMRSLKMAANKYKLSRSKIDLDAKVKEESKN